ncbi:hypothetical protein BJ878DRAFT_479992 [Calycina marina]|uniref:Uncharacterized protein n=1 Tax=Calycina marina TaxID=1763456 RepID=A0A9P7Z2X0_9HELO|nr:hypothetical protein BJ878DRAFT_479992 [Calycina marina]
MVVEVSSSNYHSGPRMDIFTHWRHSGNDTVKDKAVSRQFSTKSRPFSPSSIVVPSIRTVVLTPLIDKHPVMSSPLPTPPNSKKDVLSRLRPQRQVTNKSSDVNLSSLSPPATFTKFRKQLSTRIKRPQKGSFYIKDGAISDSIVDSRKRVAVSNGKINPGNDGTELDLSLDSDEEEIEMPEEKEFVNDRRISESGDDTGLAEGTYMSMGWDVGIDGGKFGIEPPPEKPAFAAELEGTTPATIVELEGSSIQAISSSEKEFAYSIAEKEGYTPVSIRKKEDWRPQTPIRQVRHVGHLLKDTPPPARETSMASSMTRQGGAIKAPLFTNIGPMERSDPVDTTDPRGSIATIATARSMGSLLERNRHVDCIKPNSSAEQVSLPLRQKGSTQSNESNRLVPRNIGRVPSPLQERQPQGTEIQKRSETPLAIASITSSMESIASTIILSPTRYNPNPSPSRATRLSPERSSSTSPSNLLHERQCAGTLPLANITLPEPPLEQHPMFARHLLPGDIAPPPRSACPEQIAPTALMEKPKSLLGRDLIAMSEDETPQSLLEIDLAASSREPSPEPHSATTCRPITLFDREHAETLPIAMARAKPGQGAVIKRIKRKRVPASHESLASNAAADAEEHTPEEQVQRDRDAKLKAAAAVFLQKQVPIIEADQARETTDEVKEGTVGSSLTRQNSKGMSWLSL